MALDFNNMKKASLEIILNDERQTKIHLYTPSKKLLTELVGLSKEVVLLQMTLWI